MWTVICSPAMARMLLRPSDQMRLFELHPTDWRQGKRDHVLLERASEVLAGVDEVPLPTDAEHDAQLTILDIGWEAGQLLASRTVNCRRR